MYSQRINIYHQKKKIKSQIDFEVYHGPWESKWQYFRVSLKAPQSFTTCMPNGSSQVMHAKTGWRARPGTPTNMECTPGHSKRFGVPTSVLIKPSNWLSAWPAHSTQDGVHQPCIPFLTFQSKRKGVHCCALQLKMECLHSITHFLECKHTYVFTDIYSHVN